MKPWEFINGENHLTLKLVGDLQIDSLSAFEEEAANRAKTPTYVLVDCQEVTDISPAWLRTLVIFQKTLQQGGKSLCLYHVKASIVSFVQAQGLEKALPMRSNLREAMVDMGLAAKISLDVNFINPFLEATMKVLEVQTQTMCKPGGVTRKVAGDPRFVADISGVIGLVSDAFNGSVVISFPAKTFLAVMSRMMGEEMKEINKDIEDGAGELTNMIFGQAKLALNEKGYGINTAIPSVVKGQGHSVQGITSGPVVVVPFETDAGPFFIEICLSAGVSNEIKAA